MEKPAMIRFGVYELDPRTAELRKGGRLIRLAPQPARVLILLATRAGELVSREEISAEIWGAETFVEFEQGLNNCIKQIRNALNDNADTPRYVETLPRRGYRFVAQVDAPHSGESLPDSAGAPPTAASQPAPAPQVISAARSESPPARRSGFRRSRIIAAAAIVLVGTGLTILRIGRLRQSGKRPPPGRPESSISVLVLPLDDMSPEKDQEYLAGGIAEELSNELASIRGLRLTGRATAIYLKRRIRDDRTKGKALDYPSIGKEANVAIILDGSVRKQRSRVRIAVQVINATDGFQLWSQTFENETNDIFGVEQEIARAVTRQTKTTLLASQAESALGKPPNPAAYDAYLEGLFYLIRNKEKLERAVIYFDRSISLDGGYAAAWAGLGRARIYQAESDYIPRDKGFLMARQAIERALTLDPGSVLAQTDMGDIKLRYDWDWTGADECYKRSLAIAPGHPRVIRAAASIAMVFGQWENAIALWRQSIQLDSHNVNSYYLLGLALYYAGRQEEAKAALLKTLDIAPDMAVVHSVLGRVYLAQSRWNDALNQLNIEEHPVFRLHGLALVSYAMGRTTESNRNLRELIRRFSTEAPFQIAEVYAFRGETDHAFEWLELAYKARDPALTELKGDPLLKSLQADARYPAFLTKMRLPV